MAEKIERLGISRHDDHVYYIKDGSVWGVRQSALGVPNVRPKKIADGDFEMDGDYIYFVDADGDVAREACETSSPEDTPRRQKPVSDRRLKEANRSDNAVTLALTVRQPWAALIAAGIKTIENRSWDRLSIIGQRIAIHAGQSFDADGATELNVELPHNGPAWKVLDAITSRDLGAIVCTAVVSDFVTSSTNEWFSGPIGWVLTDIHRCEPIYCSGAQRLWTLPPDIAGQLANAALASSKS